MTEKRNGKPVKKSRFEVFECSTAQVTVDVSQLAKNELLFFNATEMAKSFGKRPDDFWKQQQNREYLSALITLSEGNEKDFIRSIRGGTHPGTWFHKDLALQFARWLSPEFAVRLDKWILERVEQEKSWQVSRKTTKTGFLPLTEAIADAHDDPQHYHFSNEANMINRVALGMSAKEFCLKHRVEHVRDALSEKQLTLIQRLQRINTGLIEVGMNYNERKRLLSQRVERLAMGKLA